MASFALLSLLFLVFLFALSFTLLKVWQRVKLNLEAGGTGNDLSKVIDLLPPVFIELITMQSNTWHNQKGYRADTELLKRAGFVHEEDALTFQGTVHQHLSFWKLPKSQIGVVISEGYSTDDATVANTYQHDICLTSASGVFTLSNSMQAALMPRPKQLPLKLLANQSLQQMLAGLKTSLPTGFKPIRFTTTKALYQNRAEELAIWLYQKPQLTSDKLAGVLEPHKITLKDELLTQLIDFGIEQSSEYYCQKVILQVRARSKMKPEQWQAMQERLVVIHEKMSSQHVCDALYQLFSIEQLSALDTQMEATQQESSSLQAFDFLQQLTRSLSLTLPKCIGELEKPVKAKIFLGPLKGS